jgi:hypothetical protein
VVGTVVGVFVWVSPAIGWHCNDRRSVETTMTVLKHRYQDALKRAATDAGLAYGRGGVTFHS